MTEQTPSQDSGDVILDMTSPSDDPAQVWKKTPNYFAFVLQGLTTTDSFLLTTRVSNKSAINHKKTETKKKRRISSPWMHSL